MSCSVDYDPSRADVEETNIWPAGELYRVTWLWNTGTPINSFFMKQFHKCLAFLEHIVNSPFPDLSISIHR